MPEQKVLTSNGRSAPIGTRNGTRRQQGTTRSKVLAAVLAILIVAGGCSRNPNTSTASSTFPGSSAVSTPPETEPTTTTIPAPTGSYAATLTATTQGYVYQVSVSATVTANLDNQATQNAPPGKSVVTLTEDYTFKYTNVTPAARNGEVPVMDVGLLFPSQTTICNNAGGDFTGSVTTPGYTGGYCDLVSTGEGGPHVAAGATVTYTAEPKQWSITLPTSSISRLMAEVQQSPSWMALRSSAWTRCNTQTAATPAEYAVISKDGTCHLE